MDINKFKTLSRKEREAFLSKYDDLKAPHTEKIDKLEAEKNELTGSNSAKIAERDKAKKACSWTLFLIIAGVLAAIGIYSRSLVSIVFFVAAVALVVVKFLIYKKNKPIYEKLKLELADYDNKCAELSTLIGEEEAAIAKINEDASEYIKLHGRIERDVMNELSDIAYRERYHNTLAVYIGSKYAESESELMSESPAGWNMFASSELGDTAVCIDGKPYTVSLKFDPNGMRHECLLFHLEPGVHNITVASCPTLDPYSDPPLFTDPIASNIFTVTIDEKTPFAGIAVGISYTVKARTINKTLVTTSQTEFLETVGTEFPYTPKFEDFKHYFNENENEYVTLEKILKNYKTPAPKTLRVFTGGYILYETNKTLTSESVKNLRWAEYKSAHLFNCALNIDGCIYPLVYENSVKDDGGKIPRQYYTFTISSGVHAFRLDTQLLLWPRSVLGKEVISNMIVTDVYDFEVKPEDDFAGIAIGLASTYQSDSRILGSLIDNQSGYRITANNVYTDNDEARFMQLVEL